MGCWLSGHHRVVKTELGKAGVTSTMPASSHTQSKSQGSKNTGTLCGPQDLYQATQSDCLNKRAVASQMGLGQGVKGSDGQRVVLQ